LDASEEQEQYLRVRLLFTNGKIPKQVSAQWVVLGRRRKILR